MSTVAIVDDATVYGQGLADEFEKSAKALGIKVVSHDATNDKAADFRAILTKIKGERPDAIMYGGMDATGGKRRLVERRDIHAIDRAYAAMQRSHLAI
ncbi:ABC-type branched-subunit amino acid transport system substrate-binding protein [Paraburkholderia sp. GAS348]